MPNPELASILSALQNISQEQPAFHKEQVIRYIFDYLVCNDNDEHTKPPIRKRAHHMRSDAALILGAQSRGILENNDDFWWQGVNPASALYRYIAQDLWQHLVDLEAHPAGARLIYPSAPVPAIQYNTDVRGETPEQSLDYILHQAINILPLFRSRGDTTVFLTCTPDARCQGCAIGKHCMTGTRNIPDYLFNDKKNIWSGRDENMHFYDPRDQRLVIDYANNAKKADTCFPVETYYDPVTDRPQPITLITNMHDYRANLERYALELVPANPRRTVYRRLGRPRRTNKED